jgi:uncharacterized membrane protein YraQ (UPF0718 family)
MLIELSLLVIILLIYFSNKEKSIGGIKETLKRDWKIIPIFMVAIALSYPLTWIFTGIDLANILGSNRALNVMLGTLAGLIFPGPRYIIYPFVNQILAMGIGSGFLISLLYSQQLLSEPEGLILELKYFGKRYAVFWMLMIITIIFSTIFIFGNLFPLSPVTNFQTAGKSFMDYFSENVIAYLPIIFLAIVLSGELSHRISDNIIKRVEDSNKAKTVVLMALVGMATPGPVYEIIPILGALRKKGMSFFFITPFIAGQASIGPIRLSMELSMFGIWFCVVRIAVAFVIAILCGIVTYIVETKTSYFDE